MRRNKTVVFAALYGLIALQFLLGIATTPLAPYLDTHEGVFLLISVAALAELLLLCIAHIAALAFTSPNPDTPQGRTRQRKTILFLTLYVLVLVQLFAGFTIFILHDNLAHLSDMVFISGGALAEGAVVVAAHIASSLYNVLHRWRTARADAPPPLSAHARTLCTALYGAVTLQFLLGVAAYLLAISGDLPNPLPATVQLDKDYVPILYLLVISGGAALEGALLFFVNTLTLFARAPAPSPEHKSP